MGLDRFQLCRVHDRTVDAHAQIATASLGHDTAKAGTETACHPGLER